MITRIYADNFRCLTNFTFEPQRMNLIVGDNGSGKSALIDVILGLRFLARSGDGLTSGWFTSNSRTRWDTRTTQRFELSCTDLTGAVFDWVVVVGYDDTGKASIESETVSKDGKLIAELARGAGVFRLRGAEVPLPYELDGSFLSLRISDPDLRTLHTLVDDVMIIRLDVLRMADESSKPEAMLSSGANFASAYRRIRETDFQGTSKLHESLKTVIGGFRSLDLIDVGSETKRLVVKLFPGNGRPDYPLRLADLSDGQRALIALYTLTTTFGLINRTLFIDEPDNFVSLRELQPWLQSLTRAAEDQGGQAVLASHSPEVIDYLAADHAWLFERDDGGPTRVRPLPLDRDGSGLKASEQLARGWVRGA